MRRLGSAQRPAAETHTLRAAEYADPVARIGTALRIWLIVYGHQNDPAGVRPELRSLLSDRFRCDGSWRVKNGAAVLYVRVPTPPQAD